MPTHVFVEIVVASARRAEIKVGRRRGRGAESGEVVAVIRWRHHLARGGRRRRRGEVPEIVVVHRVRLACDDDEEDFVVAIRARTLGVCSDIISSPDDYHDGGAHRPVRPRLSAERV